MPSGAPRPCALTPTPLGIEIRVGIHTGECELLGDDIGGLAVHIAARILGQAGAGEILSPVLSATRRRLGYRVRGPRQCRAPRCSRQMGTVGGRSPWRAIKFGRGEAGVDAYPRPANLDAPVGSRSGASGEANTVDPPRGGPSRPSTVEGHDA